MRLMEAAAAALQRPATLPNAFLRPIISPSSNSPEAGPGRVVSSSFTDEIFLPSKTRCSVLEFSMLKRRCLGRSWKTRVFSRPDSMLSHGFAKPACPECGRCVQTPRNTRDLFLKEYFEV